MAKYSKEQLVQIVTGKPADTTVKEYCEQIGMRVRLYYYYRKRLGDGTRRSVLKKRSDSRTGKKASAGFIPLTVKAGTNGLPVAVLDLPNQARISIYDSAILPLLRPLLD